jgi:hypothetical protein
MWATALLLDGNIGIGGDPVALLARVASVLQPGGRILVELGPPGTSGAADLARVEHDACMGPWFAWTAVGASCIGAITAEAGLRLTSSWSAGGRWFASARHSGALMPTQGAANPALTIMALVARAADVMVRRAGEGS